MLLFLCERKNGCDSIIITSTVTVILYMTKLSIEITKEMVTISHFTKEKFSNNRVAKYLWLDLFNKGLVCFIKQKNPK